MHCLRLERDGSPTASSSPQDAIAPPYGVNLTAVIIDGLSSPVLLRSSCFSALSPVSLSLRPMRLLSFRIEGNLAYTASAYDACLVLNAIELINVVVNRC